MDYVGSPTWLMKFPHNVQLQLFFNSLIRLLNDARALIFSISRTDYFKAYTLKRTRTPFHD